MAALRERAALLEVELTERARDTDEAEEARRTADARIVALDREAAELRERVTVLDVELAERATELEALENERAFSARRAAELHEEFVDLDRRRATAERHAAEVLAAVADARDLARRRPTQLEGVDERLAALAARLDEDQLLSEARALRAQWTELDEVLEGLDAPATPPPTAAPDESLGGEATRPQAAGPA